MGAGPTPPRGSVAAELARRALRAVEDDLGRLVEVFVAPEVRVPVLSSA
jgi:hypothetical protein